MDYDRFGILKTELHLQYRHEEEFWRNKSRVLWLQAGDRNTRYFHAKTKQRRSYNRIIHVQDDRGNIYTKAKDIHTHSVNYFHFIYKSNGVNIEPDLLNGIPRTVSEEVNASLTRPVTEEEIRKALFAMNPDKSPGPDGMTVGFFQHHWNTIKSGVISYVNLFFEQSILDPKLNKPI